MMVISMASFMVVHEAEANGGAGKQGSSIERVECIGETNPILSTNLKQTDVDIFSMTVDIQQEFGKCLYRDGLTFYVMPYIPIKYEVELVDTEMNYLVTSFEKVGELSNSFQTPVWTIYSIPYCLTVTSFFMDGANITVKTHSTMCFTP